MPSTRLAWPSRSSTFTESRKPARCSTPAIASFCFEEGHETCAWRAMPALRMRVNMSAIGSVIMIGGFPVCGSSLAFGSLRETCASGSRTERHAEVREQRLALGVVAGARHHRDVEPRDVLPRVVVDLGEDDLLADAERVVAAAVERLDRDALEVAHARQRDVDEPVEELPHPRAAQGHGAADRLPLAQLEVRDRLARASDRRLLAGDRRELLGGLLDELRVLRRLAHAHVHHDLLEARHLMDVLEPELLRELGHDLGAISLEQSRRHLRAPRARAR